MKIKYMGKLDPETNPLPTNKLKEGAIRFYTREYFISSFKAMSVLFL